MGRCVRGHFFAEYVRMIRRRKDVDWQRWLLDEDMAFVKDRVRPDAWYPMETFERLGVAILAGFEGATLDAVRFWGRSSASQYAVEHPALIAQGDPVDSLMRLKVMRSTLFNFQAFDVPMLAPAHAHVVVMYYMGARAEEAASHQTMGFCEAILSLSGATDVAAKFEERAWTGDRRTLLSLEWTHPVRR